jgi:two-component system alkaline phosphatase synthesis response regulator PhoP
MNRVLIVEDEAHLADGLRFNFEAEGFEVEVAESGEAAMAFFEQRTTDVLVLDVMLPGISGFEVARQLREQGNFVPTLMLTARGRPEDVLKGFESGADDYLPKPFDLAILLARVRGLLRRREWMSRRPRNVFTFRGRSIDFDNLEIRTGDRRLTLTRMEANLLRYLIEREGRIVPRKELLEEVWGVHEDTDTRAIDNFIVRLRRYLEDSASEPQHLLTVRGVGYRFVS